MNYKNKKWNDFDISFLEKFNNEVPIYTPSIYREYRGEIFTTFHSSEHPSLYHIKSLGYKNVKIHNRFSKSYENVLRGLHYDNKTWKLVQALVGEIYLVILDTRINSKTYGEWESYILSEKTRDQILIPPEFANGHYALTDCIFHYNLFYEGDYVDENNQSIIKWNDTRFNIEWPTNNPILQNRDK